MTRSEFVSSLTPVVRHGLTALAGVLAVHAATAPAADLLTAWAAPIAVFAAGLGWSLVEKSKLLASLASNAPMTDLEAMLAALAEVRAKGASALVVAHLTQAAAMLAASELGALQAPAEAPVSSPDPVAPLGDNPVPETQVEQIVAPEAAPAAASDPSAEAQS